MIRKLDNIDSISVWFRGVTRLFFFREQLNKYNYEKERKRVNIVKKQE